MRIRSILPAAVGVALVLSGGGVPAAATPLPAAARVVEAVTASGLERATPAAIPAGAAVPGIDGGAVPADGTSPVGWLLSEAAVLGALGLAFVGAGTVAARRRSAAG